MADRQYRPLGTVSAPADWNLPASLEITPKTAYAKFDGTSAAGPYLPCLRIISDAGIVAAEAVATTQVAAGASVDASWFRGVGAQTVSSGSGVPPFPALDDYVFKHSNTVVTGTGHGSQTNLIIQGNPISLDGSTRIQIEFFAPIVEVLNGDQNQAIGFELWDGSTDVGTILYIEGGMQAGGGTGWVFGHGAYSKNILTPTAGSHTYAVYAYRNDGSGTCTVFASTFADGSGSVGPAWYRVTTT